MSNNVTERSVFPSSAPAGVNDLCLACAVALISLLIFGAAVPFARVPLIEVHAFIPIYQSALTVNDVITCVLLFAQFTIVRSRGLLVLACGYLFTAVMAAVHLLTFPGLFSNAGLLGAGPQTTAWLYMFWHGGFPLAVIAYAWLKNPNIHADFRTVSSSRSVILFGIAAVLASACALTLLATAGQAVLPPIMRGNSYTPVMMTVVSIVWLSSALALLALLASRRPYSVLDLWLMIVMWAWLLDVAMSAVFNAGRFDVGFYAGRIYGLLSATFVLIVLLFEMGVLYARLARSFESEQHERRRIFETSLDLILVTDRSGNFIRVSPSAVSTLGYSPEEMIGRGAVEFIHPDDLDPTRAEMRSARRGQDIRHFETRYLHKEGRIVTLAWNGVWSEPEQRHFFIGRDITEKKAAEERLRQLAHYDQLTGLPNRASLLSDLSDSVARSTGDDRRPTSIAIFDLDGFKDINDALGHSIGDMLLQRVAQRLSEAVQDSARFYRLGGDEFVLVMADCGDPRAVGYLVNAALGRLSECFEISDHPLFVRGSAGIAIAPADGVTVEDLISSADLALYDAKASGGHTYRLFVPVMRARAQARLELDAELRRAFADEEFVLHFQPQVRLSDGVVVGAEALLRWQHPTRGILEPGAFIEALSESAVALDVGKWILQTACESAARWRVLGDAPIRIGVNLFPI